MASYLILWQQLAPFRVHKMYASGMCGYSGIKPGLSATQNMQDFQQREREILFTVINLCFYRVFFSGLSVSVYRRNHA